MFRKVLLSFWAGQTRRRLGGRQPLCGTGVTSEIAPTSRPIAPSERIAVSRPEPGPLTNTSTRFMPCSIARRPAASAAICAAYGVDFRDPLNPTVPADAHAMTAPLGSVIEMTVLLKVLLMCAWPATMFFFSLRRTFLAAPPRPAVAISSQILPYLAFFLPATGLRAPFRERALVRVRWPRTGKPLR